MKKLLSHLLSLFGASAVKKPRAYRRVNAAQAAEMMQVAQEYIILDVRRRDEYAAGHIKGAINLPNEDIGTAEIPLLPQKDQLIFVHCQSGRRSRMAAEKLAALGYTDIVDFGGIFAWKDGLVT